MARKEGFTFTTLLHCMKDYEPMKPMKPQFFHDLFFFQYKPQNICHSSSTDLNLSQSTANRTCFDTRARKKKKKKWVCWVTIYITSTGTWPAVSICWAGSQEKGLEIRILCFVRITCKASDFLCQMLCTFYRITRLPMLFFFLSKQKRHTFGCRQ